MYYFKPHKLENLFRNRVCSMIYNIKPVLGWLSLIVCYLLETFEFVTMAFSTKVIYIIVLQGYNCVIIVICVLQIVSYHEESVSFTSLYRYVCTSL